MRYRPPQLSVRDPELHGAGVGQLVEVWPSERLRLLVQGRWWPDADAYETARTVEIVVELAVSATTISRSSSSTTRSWYRDAGICREEPRVPLPCGPDPAGPLRPGAVAAVGGGARARHGALRARPAVHHASQARRGAVMAVPSAASASDIAIPDALPVLPLRDAVVFPLTPVPLAVGQSRSLALVDEVMRGNRLLTLVAQRASGAEPAMPDDLHRVGTVGLIHQLGRPPHAGGDRRHAGPGADPLLRGSSRGRQDQPRSESRSTTCFTPIGRCGGRARGRASSRSAPR
jgi:ATP-dependent protease La (LON) substrate-binding domain